eukprot:TRINITY_DN14693_c0_g1_i2.p1 TRINITY_DN14693_c0_g1~~TRINITY_DN14693_c0_g1_i2.p1  ORF type:complete len:100 (+),score=10.74 TRINITY_DN14693_c0_g1_i2:94-393(+)
MCIRDRYQRRVRGSSNSKHARDDSRLFHCAWILSLRLTKTAWHLNILLVNANRTKDASSRRHRTRQSLDDLKGNADGELLLARETPLPNFTLRLETVGT